MKLIKVVAYARFSSTKQREESIIHQLEKIREYCSKNGFEIVEEYIDEAQSATTDKRIRFQEMINDAEFADWRYIVVYKFDRLSRNVSDAFHYKKHLLRLGKQIISVIEDFDSNTPEGGFFNLISMGMSEFYVNNMRREIIAGLMQNARSARATGGIPPLGYGYGKDQKHFVIEQEAEAVRLIFQMVGEGFSYKDIANTLNQKGYRTKLGKEFNGVFTDLLINRKYIGEFVYNRTTKKNLDGKRNNHQSKAESEIVRIPNGMPQIIDETLFYKVQGLLKKRKHEKYYTKTRSKYLLTGTLQCAYCNRSVVGNLAHSGRNKTIRITYACKKKNPNRCQMKELNMLNLDRVVTEIISRTILVKENADKLTQLTKENQRLFIEKTKNRIKEIGIEIDSLNNEIDEIELSNTDRKKSIARVNSDVIRDKDIQIRELEQERISLLGDLEVLKRPSQTIIENSIRSFKNSFYGKPLEIQKATIKRLIRRIIISNEGINILINLKALMKIDKDVVGNIDYSIVVPRMSIVYPKRFPFQADIKTESQ